MKPHIRRAYCSAVKGWWICLNRTATGMVVYYKAGMGLSMAEAYSDWERQNVDQNS
jgi:hypothetical protein